MIDVWILAAPVAIILCCFAHEAWDWFSSWLD